MDSMHSTLSMYYDYGAHVKGELLVMMKNFQSVNLLIFISNTLIELFNDFGFDCDGIPKRPTMYLNLWSYKVVRHRYSNPMIQPEPEGSTQGYPLDSVEVLRRLFLIDLPDHKGRSSQIRKVTKDGHGGILVPADSQILSHMSSPDLKYKDIMKAQNFKEEFSSLYTERLSRSDEVLKLKILRKMQSLKLSSYQSTKGSARIWLEKEPPHLILTWDDLVSKFINQFFLPSKTTNLRNEITRFQQRFDESFYEAWDRFNDLLRACLHHGFLELHQLDTFYNALNANDQDSLNSAAGGNFLDKMPRECLRIIESKSKVRNSQNKTQKAQAPAPVKAVEQSCVTCGGAHSYKNCPATMKTMLIDKQKAQAPAPVKAVEQSYVTYGGAHSYRNCPATDDNVYRDNIQEYVSQAAAANFNQGNTNSRPPMVSNQIRPLVFLRFKIIKNQPRFTKPDDKFNGDAFKFVNSNTASSSNSGSLPSNTVTNLKEDLKGITTISGIAYQGPTIPTSSPKVVERRTEVTKDTIFPTNNEITEDVQPPVVPVEKQNPVSEPDVAPVSAPMPNQKSSIPYPSRRNDERQEKF
ncbi:reverse transcriptase domain-containing protein [Tanacetum coccineum]